MISRAERRNRARAKRAKEAAQIKTKKPQPSGSQNEEPLSSPNRFSTLLQNNAVWGVLGLMFAAIALTLPAMVSASSFVLGFGLITYATARSHIFAKSRVVVRVVVKCILVALIGVAFCSFWFYLQSLQKEPLSANDIEKIVRDSIANGKIGPRITIQLAKLESPINLGGFPVAKIEIRNAGDSIASNITHNTMSALFNPQAVMDARNGILPSIQNPGATRRVSQAMLEVGGYLPFTTSRTGWESAKHKTETLKGLWTFYVWGEIFYSDEKGRKYRSRFCMYNDDIKDVYFTLCESHNDIQEIK